MAKDLAHLLHFIDEETDICLLRISDSMVISKIDFGALDCLFRTSGFLHHAQLNSLGNLDEDAVVLPYL